MRCSTCGGAWCAELVLLDLVADAANLPLSALQWLDRAAAAPLRACERCARAMKPVALYGVDLDRCPGHGIWLDGDELERVLHEAPRHNTWHPRGSTANVRPEGEPWVSNAVLGNSDRLDDTGGVFSALVKLFSR